MKFTHDELYVGMWELKVEGCKSLHEIRLWCNNIVVCYIYHGLQQGSGTLGS